MERPTPTIEILNAVKAILEKVPGIGQVDTQAGKQTPWSRLRHREFMWLVQVQSIRQVIESIPGRRRRISVRREIEVTVDGWYPADEQADTNSAWVQKVARVKATLQENFRITGSVLLIGYPDQQSDDYQLMTSLHQGDVPTLCHYGRIALSLVDGYDLETL
jgi:hypothetical protein